MELSIIVSAKRHYVVFSEIERYTSDALLENTAIAYQYI